MRLLAFILFFAGIILAIDSLTTLAEVTPEENAFLVARIRSASHPEDTEQLHLLEKEASKAKKARLLWFSRNAIASASFFFLGVVLLMRRLPLNPAAVSMPPPRPPDLDALLGVVRSQPFATRASITHFYGSRRARCRAARARLKSKIDLFFETSAATSEDHPADS